MLSYQDDETKKSIDNYRNKVYCNKFPTVTYSYI
jgi:hypothetical protein